MVSAFVPPEDFEIVFIVDEKPLIVPEGVNVFAPFEALLLVTI